MKKGLMTRLLAELQKGSQLIEVVCERMAFATGLMRIGQRINYLTGQREDCKKIRFADFNRSSPIPTFELIASKIFMFCDLSNALVKFGVFTIKNNTIVFPFCLR